MVLDLFRFNRYIYVRISSSSYIHTMLQSDALGKNINLLPQLFPSCEALGLALPDP